MSPYQPHGQGFIEQINIMLDGNVKVAFTRDMVICRSSSGSRKASSVSFLNSGNSSKNNTP